MSSSLLVDIRGGKEGGLDCEELWVGRVPCRKEWDGGGMFDGTA